MVVHDTLPTYASSVVLTRNERVVVVKARLSVRTDQDKNPGERARIGTNPRSPTSRLRRQLGAEHLERLDGAGWPTGVRY